MIIVASPSVAQELRQKLSGIDPSKVLIGDGSFKWIDLLGWGGPARRLYEEATKEPDPRLSRIVDLEEARQRYNFDLGHPEDGAAYLENPAVSGHYIQPAKYNQRFNQEKVAAFVEICDALGCKTLSLESGNIDKQSRDAGITIRDAAIEAGLNVDLKDEHTVGKQVYAEFAKPQEPPHLPASLERWTHQDPILRSLVSSRLNHSRLMKKKVTLNLENESKFAAELSAKLPEIGVKVGGKHSKVTESTWSFDVEFWE
jgi:hypothetical protein